MSLKLHIELGSPCCLKTMLTASATGTEITLITHTDDSYKTAEFLQSNPNGCLPFLETPKGPIYQSEGISDYFIANNPNTKLNGSSTHDTSLIAQFRSVASGLAQTACSITGTLWGNVDPAPKNFKEATDLFVTNLKSFNDHINGKSFIVGDSLTIADIQLVSTIYNAFSFGLSSEQIKEVSNVDAYLKVQTQQSYFKQWFSKSRFSDDKFKLINQKEFKQFHNKMKKNQHENDGSKPNKSNKSNIAEGQPMVLHVLVGSPYCEKVMIVAAATNSDISFKYYKTLNELKTKEMIKINPNCQVPVLETSEGVIYQSSAINEYLLRKANALSFMGSTPFEASQVLQWKENVPHLLKTGFITQLVHHCGFVCPDAQIVADSKKQFLENAKIFENHLKNKENKNFLVGDCITLADVEFIVFIKKVFSFFFEGKERKQLKFLTKYIENLTKIECVKKYLGGFIIPSQTLKLITKEDFEKISNPNKANTNQAAKVDSRGVPASPFVLYNFKTFAVNEKNFDLVIDKLKSEFDSNAFSIWRARYTKLPSEGKEFIRTANSLTNFLKDVNNFSKYLIGSYSIYGDEPDLEIRGVYLWNHPDFLPEMKEHSSCEYIEWKKLDIKNEEDVKLLKSYWNSQNSDVDKVEGLTLRRFHWVK